MTPEALLIQALHQALPDVPVHAQVPSTRPPMFITVERTGGPRTRFLDQGTYALQCWATATPPQSGRTAAAHLCDRLATALLGLPADHHDVAATSVISSYHFPDPDSGQGRYQLTALAVVTTSRKASHG